MIANWVELEAALDYSAKLADALEGIRQYTREMGGTPSLLASMDGPLTHLRENLSEIRAYTERFSSPDAALYAKAAALSFSMGGVSTAPAEMERERVAR